MSKESSPMRTDNQDSDLMGRVHDAMPEEFDWELVVGSLLGVCAEEEKK